MRELDVLLGNYLAQHYPHADDTQKAAFRRVLQLPDPDVMSYLLHGDDPADPEMASVIERIRGSSSS